IRTSTGDTAFLSNSWVIIQAKSLAPSLEVQFGTVASGQSVNGVTTTVATTISSVPFGNISLAQAEFAAHSIRVITNDASKGVVVRTQLANPFQGVYPNNSFDQFGGSGASWNSPIAWTSPTGTVTNVDTG